MLLVSMYFCMYQRGKESLHDQSFTSLMDNYALFRRTIIVKTPFADEIHFATMLHRQR